MNSPSPRSIAGYLPIAEPKNVPREIGVAGLQDRLVMDLMLELASDGLARARIDTVGLLPDPASARLAHAESVARHPDGESRTRREQEFTNIKVNRRYPQML